MENFKRIEEKFGKISEKGLSPEIVIDSIIKTFLKGVPNWRSPFLQYNICSPVNIVASALACIANELNIHNISTDFAGTCLSAEIAISRIIAKLIDKDPSTIRGIFTFGGTGSNMYAFKLAFNHIDPLIYKKGLKDKIYYFITENAHFSHKTIADWLGLGFDRLIIIKADKESRSLVSDAKTKMEEIIKNGGIIAGITLNGGPFYDFAIDDIEAFVKLREWLIKKYKLQYKFRIHVDSVIGWIWLVFNGYDFERNPLKIPEDVKPLIKNQFNQTKRKNFYRKVKLTFYRLNTDKLVLIR
ncbi:MAG: pyridoxal-dependent decarboxylase [Candidatus Pacearchaeota archaeon]